MRRILFAWELGAGYGHLGPFRAVAQTLLARGHEVTVAAREVERAQVVFRDIPVGVVQSPVCIKTYNGLAEPPLNYAEILMRYGYLDAPQLTGLLRAWRGLVGLTRAEIVIADHAPSLLLAVRGLAVARLVMGSPFTVPPRLNPTPNMRPWANIPPQRLASSDASVLACINAGIPKGAAPLAALSELFSDTDCLLTGVPELDPYGPRSAEQYLGLHAGLLGVQEPRWPSGDGVRVFAYLNGDYAHLEPAISALAASGARCVIFALGITPALRGKYEGERLAFSDGLLDIDRAVSASDCCVCHGNFGTVSEILRRGKPMLLLPMQLEHFLLASRLESMGIACVVHPEVQPLDIGGALERALRQPSLAEAARIFALKHREPSVDTIVQRAADRIESLARNQGTPG